MLIALIATIGRDAGRCVLLCAWRLVGCVWVGVGVRQRASTVVKVRESANSNLAISYGANITSKK